MAVVVAAAELTNQEPRLQTAAIHLAAAVAVAGDPLTDLLLRVEQT